ncbi:putative importin-beta domain, importin beta family [Helianthus annuus]|uniref:Importin-beta domain, importin beta family n=1 Tax=Helianthus annuus TaxID=4232 RepID=A0A251V6R5_HELAN|nr:importin-4 [Helianthus annuus]KAF5813829.1 putative importin-beta domain, importin beta family [Helianthus annuus]KAJ0592525.1 putative importin-beta domain, armadillo-like helical, importin beta family [Helianthus annuus]KAJ0600098.1 putative importin-beta domain, importin beta family [Helianthus annuus]KAJ0607517.1 putative importin-beta domain, armadillo-like helical, importin beta family [Helianthus annuus]KAJ0767581.1 putative importin-beta domain, armadillo-like helical, importin beta
MSQSLELLLIQFLMPDNDARRQAEDQIKRLAKDPQVVPALIHHLRTAKTPNVRQLAAVLLRKKITGHWAKLPPQLRQLVKQSLIESITMEHSPPVRRASANVVSIIAKYAVPGGEWPDLLPFLFQCSQSPQEDHREVALILFSSLTETIGDSFRPYFADLQALLLKCLQDETSNNVRVAALKAVGSFIEFTHDAAEVIKFREFIPSILNVSRQCIASGDEDVAIIAFEIFDELIESPAPLLGDSVKAIVQFSLEVCSSPNLDSSTRHQAIQIISWLAKYKSSSLKKHSLIIPILQVLCPLLTESANREEGDDDLAPDRAAAEVLDTMSLKLPKHVFPPVFEFASLSSQSVDPKFREASVTVLGVVSEGCLELMKEKLGPVLHIVLGGLRDPEQVVRGASSFALGQFAEYLQPEIISHYESVLPCILNAIEDSSDDVKEKSYYALAAFCENMGEEILPFLDSLMGKLFAALQTSKRMLQETCMSAIGSVASAAEQAFLPYAECVLELMKNFMVLTSDEDLRSRARATELVGIVAMVVGRARMEPILPPFIEAAISGYGLEYSELREYTHGFFSNVAEILEDGMVQYLPHVVPLAFASCNLDDGSAVDIDDSDDDNENVNGFGGVSSDDEAHDEPRMRNISIRTGVLDEKAAATQALGLFALHTKSAYAPYLEESLRIMVKHSSYFHEDVRLQAITGLKNILIAAHAVFQVQNDGAAKAREIFESVMNIYIKTMNEDDDKEVVAQACMSVADIIKDFGYVAIEPYMPRLVESTLVLLKQESVCQQIESDSDIDDDDTEHDEVLMDAVSDLLPAFAKAMGTHFAPIFATLFDPLMKFAKGSRPAQDRTMVVACLAEVAQDMGAPIAAYVDAIMPLVLKELASSSETNRRNAAFCVGELCKNGGTSSLKYFGDVLRGLYPLFGESEPDDAVKDNAAGAVARMIMAHQDSVPLNQVLPVFVKGLPLKEDHEESMPVYSCICNLVLSSNQQIAPLVPDLVNVFAQVAASPLETPEVKVQIGRAFAHLLSIYGQQMQPLLGSLSPAHANALAAIAPKS